MRWALNPLTALVLAPTVNLWSLAAFATRGRAAGAGLLIAGLIVPAGAAGLMLARLDLDPLAGGWYGVLTVLGGHAGVGAATLACLTLSGLVTLLGIAAGRPRPAPVEPAPRERPSGARRHLGPGSLGGTESALRRR
jgi:hypothetical protein